MNNSTPKSTHGGRRPGAGRKRKTPTPEALARFSDMTAGEIMRRSMVEMAAKGDWRGAARVAEKIAEQDRWQAELAERKKVLNF